MRGRSLAAVLLGFLGDRVGGQGLGILPGTGFMVGDLKWAVIGAGMVIVGASCSGSAPAAATA